MRVLGISGSLRQESYNTRLLWAAATSLPPGTELAICEGIGTVPAYDPDLDGETPPEPAEHLRQDIASADALLVATPEYNASIPGLLKNAIDWASRPFPDNALRSKPVAVVGASTGRFGAVWAQAELRKVLGLAGARVLDVELAVPRAEEAFDADGSLRVAALRRRLSQLLKALVDEGRRSLSTRGEEARSTLTRTA